MIIEFLSDGGFHLRVCPPVGTLPPIDVMDCDGHCKVTLLKGANGLPELRVHSDFGTNSQFTVPEPALEHASPGPTTPATPPASPPASPPVNAPAGGAPPSYDPMHAPTPSTQRWYMVTRGRQVGVFQGLSNAQVHVEGLSGALWGRVASSEEGQEVFAKLLKEGGVYLIENNSTAIQVLSNMYYKGMLEGGAAQDSADGGEGTATG
jgi:hypothetical protein